MQRQQWIDVYKGIGIMLVVAGHQFPDYTYDLIFMFHMPLFFFISGFLFRPVSRQADSATHPVRTALHKKTIQLLVPYLFFSLVVYVPQIISAWLGGPAQWPVAKHDLWSLLVGGRDMVGWGTAFWFATCLLTVVWIETLLIARFKRMTLIVLHLLMLAISYVNDIWFPDIWSIGNSSVALAAAPLFYTGYLFKDLHNRMQQAPRIALPINLGCTLIALTGLALVAANKYFAWQKPVYYDMKSAVYGIPVATLLAALACCISLAWIAKQIERLAPSVARVLAALGQASLVVMFMHEIFAYGIYDIVGVLPLPVVFMLSLVGSYLTYLLAQQWRWSRACVTGSVSDWNSLWKRRETAVPSRAMSPSGTANDRQNDTNKRQEFRKMKQQS